MANKYLITDNRSIAVLDPQPLDAGDTQSPVAAANGGQDRVH
jgi:hypothetical protein